MKYPITQMSLNMNYRKSEK